ncbi:cell wall hydrolase [Bacillus sp. HMF5848]|uniref:N-acetylmuramoyl-L-alanine amidase n=1 Tax=Bacillus sp. HMF5848 TaxID=2495421 RepID=UPI000F783ACB|nr:N-acetylmuramoyl-L-alanine amidase [Bacillus sp. HMF5848]RSK28640.1 cell wall hydrolase [Bacillus sp. HMF5848]
MSQKGLLALLLSIVMVMSIFMSDSVLAASDETDPVACEKQDETSTEDETSPEDNTSEDGSSTEDASENTSDTETESTPCDEAEVKKVIRGVVVKSTPPPVETEEVVVPVVELDSKEVFLNSIPQYFADVSAEDLNTKEIHYLYMTDVIIGYKLNGQAYFKPENNLTRAQAAKMLVEALGEEQRVVEKPTFPDVPVTHWASGYIERAVQLGILSGYENGLFGPENKLKRSQLTKMVVKAFNMNVDKVDESSFTDVSINYWAKNNIETLYNEGIVEASGFIFRPEEKATRRDFAVILSRAIRDELRIDPAASAASMIGIVTADSGLNVRNLATLNSQVIGKLLPGEQVQVIHLYGYWAEIVYNGSKAYVHKSYLKLKNVNAPVLKNRIIVLDAGHGGKDPGAVYFGIREKDVNLSVALKVRDLLEDAGAKVVMTRDSDVFLSLGERVEKTFNEYGELFVSIHANALPSKPSIDGSETYYDTTENDNAAESKALADTIQTQLVKQASMADRGIKDERFYVIRNNDVPSVLVELGFLTSDDDAQKLKSATYHDLYANAIYQGILDYYTK